MKNLYQSPIFLLAFVVMVMLFIAPTFAQSQTGMNMKAYSDYKKADAELNVVYQKILKSYSKETIFIKKFRNAQRLWIQLRDAELAAKYPNNGTYGSVAPMCESIYLETLTRERIIFLNVWVTGIQEGEVCLGSVRMKS
ncbi:lysozyme inhibitor LprI family protein [Pedobacter sp. Leaf250]|uniref:lysozyme inhibitor LprI family protein n=1 Tax=Pedobacter sp. Leaf250 TaxID=2876559 RepID=UPI001E37BF71|nr:lysozyme inhibitor LprI family protein [Pedobacter sp. Leaf250]